MINSWIPTPMLTDELSVASVLDVADTPIFVQTIGATGISVPVKPGLTPRVVVARFDPKGNRSGIFTVNPQKFSRRLGRNVPIGAIEAKSATKPAGRPNRTGDQTSVKTPQGILNHGPIAFVHRPIGDQIRGAGLH